MSMEFSHYVTAVSLGNIMTLCVVWGAVQFHRHDYHAPWLAYAAFCLPLVLIAISVYLTEGLPTRIGG